MLDFAAREVPRGSISIVADLEVREVRGCQEDGMNGIKGRLWGLGRVRREVLKLE